MCSLLISVCTSLVKGRRCFTLCDLIFWRRNLWAMWVLWKFSLHVSKVLLFRRIEDVVWWIRSILIFMLLERRAQLFDSCSMKDFVKWTSEADISTKLIHSVMHSTVGRVSGSSFFWNILDHLNAAETVSVSNCCNTVRPNRITSGSEDTKCLEEFSSIISHCAPITRPGWHVKKNPPKKITFCLIKTENRWQTYNNERERVTQVLLSLFWKFSASKFDRREVKHSKCYIQFREHRGIVLLHSKAEWGEIDGRILEY